MLNYKVKQVGDKEDETLGFWARTNMVSPMTLIKSKGIKKVILLAEEKVKLEMSLELL